MKIDRRKLLAAAAGMAIIGGMRGSGLALANPGGLESPFSLGVASGDPWPDGFVIWTRLAPRPLEPGGGMPMAAIAVRWEVAEDDRFTRIVRSGEAFARPELAHSVHVEVSGLKPHRPYWYRFALPEGEYSSAGICRTAPAAGMIVDKVRIAVAGCQSYPHGWYEAFRHLSNEPELDAVFHYGDYIYEHGGQSMIEIRDGQGGVVRRRHVSDEIYSLDDYRRRYAQYKSDPDLQAAHAAAAFVVSFDDHEIDNNWADVYDQDGTPPEVFALRRVAALQAWYEHMPVRRGQFPHPSGLKMYRTLDYGALVRMHVLDTRSYRSDQLCEREGEVLCRSADDPSETMLGKAQESWLSEQLRNDARWNLVAQQVRVMSLQRRTPEGSLMPEPTDPWSGYPEARKRLVASIREAGLTNVVIASGDAHMHNVGTVPVDAHDPGGAAIATEFLTSSMTSGGDGAPVTSTIQAYLDGGNPNLALANHQRGYNVFDITSERLQADIKVMDQVQAPGGQISRLARFGVTPDRPVLHSGT